MTAAPSPLGSGAVPALDRAAVAERERLTLYTDRAALFDRAAARDDRISLALSYGRVATFAATSAAVLAAVWAPGSARLLLVAASAAGVALFVGLVVAHARVETRKRWNQARARQNRDQLARVRRDWNTVPRADLADPPPDHPYAADLDLVGRASLADLLGAPATPVGRRLLGEWLLSPAPPDEVGRRQHAVAELALELEWRQQVHALGSLAAFSPAGLTRFLEWAEEAPWLLAHPLLVWAARLLPALTAVFIAVDGFDEGATRLWVLPVLANVIVWYAVSRRLRDAFDRVEAHQTTSGLAERLFRVVRDHAFRTPELTALTATLGAGRHAADEAFAHLGRLLPLVELRHSSLLHFPVNALALWDLHVLWALERWRARSGRQIRSWFDTLGELEALSSLAGLCHDNPDWAFPDLAPAAPATTTTAPVLEARGLAHPMLPRGVRVANDVRIGPPGRFLFVTGSNMSGKSTLLRAVGVNVVLAQAGGPVAASAFRLPPVELRTMMRVQDSLELGTSYFMAALNRLRQVIAPATSASADAPALLYLLDEILQGTNTAERRIAVRTILRHLLARPAIGAVTSHDLTLADAADLERAADPVHFTESVDGASGEATLSFDYRLRPGVATSRNALKLLALVGLTADEPAPPADPGDSP